ncbi:ferric iron reductase, partial [Microbispora sp. NPDC049633]|uniref:ferric iron reductase n=1 Tax=Microbispora sp. NPDC049633 TaxID=3154355 RepID=UPI003440C1D3
LAGALAAGADGVPEAVLARRAADPVAWWEAYVERVAYPVLDAFFRHGVALEAHVQNVLVGFDAGGWPVEAVFRDLEGTKLVAGRHDLTGLPGAVADPLSYDAARGWNRVAYCLFVNHLAEVAATVAATVAAAVAGTAADTADGVLRALWAAARAALSRYVEDHAAGPADPLTRLLAGAPLPAKANLGVRWARAADRAAGYVPVPNPLGVECVAEGERR